MNILPGEAIEAPTGILGRTFASLRIRNFRLFFTGQAVSLIGTWMQRAALSWLVYVLTGSKLMLGMVEAAGSLPFLLFALLGGSVADRFPRRTVLYVTQTGIMIASFILAARTMTHHITVWEIIILAAMSGLFMAFDVPVRQAFVVDMVGPANLINAIALNSSLFNGARIIGPAIAGLIMASLGTGFCFLANGISFVAVLVALMMLRLPPAAPRSTHHDRSVMGHTMEGIRYVLKRRHLVGVMGLLAVIGVFGMSYNVLLPAYASDLLHIREQGYGFLMAAGGLGAVFGALTVAAIGESIRRSITIIGGTCLFAVSIIFLSVFHSYPLALCMMFLGGMGMVAFFASANTYVQLNVDNEVRGRVMGIWALIFGGTGPLGGIWAGGMAHLFGIPVTLQVGSGICLAFALAMALIILKSRDNGGAAR